MRTVLLALACAALAGCKPRLAEIPDACAGPPLRSVEKREAAMQAGYEVLPGWDCISRRSHEAIEQEKQRRAQAAKQPPPAAPEPVPAMTLTEARKGFRTNVSVASMDNFPVQPLPSPPAALFVRTDYRSGDLTLPAFVTPDPRDGRKHPAIVWMTGGDTNSLSEFWRAGPEYVSAFPDAGVVLMLPALRGGNGGPGRKEYLLGEVDDVMAAGEHLASLPYVDPKQVYLGGHSVGGTLALLAAESGARFKAVFAFGPVSEVVRYAGPLLPVRWGDLDPREAELRSPLHWLSGISMPTYVIEGARGNDDELRRLCRASRNPLLVCIEVPREDHFTVLPRVTKTIAARIAVAGDGLEVKLRPEEFSQ